MTELRINSRIRSLLVTSRQWAKVHPVILVAPMAVLVAALFWFVQSRSFTEREASTPHDMTVAVDGVRERLDAGLEYLHLLAEDMAGGSLTEDTFHLRASVFVREHPELLTIAFADPASVYRWVAPYEDNKQIVGLSLSSRADNQAAKEALSTGRARFTPAYLTPRGIKGVAVFVPVFRGEQFIGTFSCVFVLDRLLSAAMPKWLTDRYEISFSRASGDVLSRLTDSRNVDTRLASTGSLNVENLDLTLKMVRYNEGIDWEMTVFIALTATMTMAIAMVVIGLNRDNIHRRKIADEYRRAKDLAESANQSKSQFIANISHEIRTPIGAIMGYSELLLRPNPTEAETHEAGIAIRRNASNLLDIINDLLDLSKVESGLMEIESRRVPLAELISEVIAAVKLQADAKRLTLRVEQRGMIPEMITTDPLRLRQILINIIGNAIKFTSAGEIVLELCLRMPSDPDSKPVFELAVRDTGIGISEQQASNLFRPFMQADRFIARKFGGSGLGLALSKQLAQILGGDLILSRSSLGEGSTFTISIEPGSLLGVRLMDKIIPLEEPHAEGIRKPRKRLLGAKVLLVEDGLDNQIIFKEFLRSEGAEVSGAEDGFKALDICRSGREFDIILMDIQMPGMDGYQTTRELRNLNIRRPIVALTAHAMAHDRQKCLDAGCDDYASKPIEKAALLATCARWMHPATSENIFPVRDDVLHSDLQDDPDLGDLVAGFVDALGARLETLNDRLAAGDLEEVARRVHQLKGAAGGYGFPTISEAARVVEQAVQLGREPAAIAHALAHLEARCLAARRAQRQSTITGREPATP